MSRSHIAAIALIAATSLAPAPASIAQEGRQAAIAPQRSLAATQATGELTAEQQAQLADLAKSVDSRVLAGFRGREDLKARMENDLRDIAKISERSAKIRAIAAFQGRYSKDYREVLTAGGVDLRQVAERLRAIFPDGVFVVENGTHVVEAETPPPPAAPPSPPATTRQAVTGPQMTQDPRSQGCGGGGTGRIDTSRPSGQTNSAKVSNIGNCAGIGWMNYRFETPQGMKSRITGMVNLNAEASVVAVTGASYASASTSVIRTGSNFATNGFGEFPHASARVWVALAWAASKSDPRPRQTIDEIDQRGLAGPIGVSYFRARTSTSAWSLSFHGDADAWASVQNIDAVITTRPFALDEAR
jgi:hypothetical protein